uniref:Predicted protein n=1 Tax=Physcomitrium patens TaxID=3218 RepID=A9U489_PHYPA
MEEINQGPQDSRIHQIEVVQAILARNLQKEKRPIQHFSDPKEKGQLDPITGTSNPGLDMGPLLSIRPESVVHPNEILKLEAQVRELGEYTEDLSNQLRKESMDRLEEEEED